MKTVVIGVGAPLADAWVHWECPSGGGAVSRYVKDLPTAVGRDDAWRVASDYLQSEGFGYVDERGEQVWRKGIGAMVIPQFVKVEPGEKTVHLEAWVSGFAFLPGVYAGEQDLTGFYGWAVKGPLKKRVAELEKRLTAGTSS
jgi:hypothetical protein